MGPPSVTAAASAASHKGAGKPRRDLLQTTIDDMEEWGTVERNSVKWFGSEKKRLAGHLQRLEDDLIIARDTFPPGSVDWAQHDVARKQVCGIRMLSGQVPA